MSAVGPFFIADTYKDILFAGSGNTGLTASFAPVGDGAGGSSPLALSTAGVRINGLIMPTSDGTSGQVISTDGAGNLSFITVAASLSLDGLTDVTITAASSGHILRYNGSAWVNASLATAGISAVGHTHTAADVTDLASATVTFTNKSGNISQWTNNSGYLTSISAFGIDALSDVTITAAATGDYLRYNGSAWVDVAVTQLETDINHDNLTGFVVNEHIDWTSTSSNFSTSGTAATGALTVTGNIGVTGTVDGRDVSTDGTKLDGIEAGADVTDDANVKAALDGMVLTAVTVAGTDKVLIQDVSDSDNLKTVTAQSIADLTPTLTQEQVEDFAGGMITNVTGTKTGITFTYQDATNDLDVVVSDTTVAGDTGSTGITPGDTLTIAGGTNCTSVMSGDTLTVNVDDAFLLNTGDTGSGTYSITGDLSVDNININGNTISSTNANGNIIIDPNGTGNIAIGNYTLDGDQTVGAGQDNYVMTYDNATGLVSLEVNTGGSGIANVVEDLTPQLGGDLDLNGNQITSPDGTDQIDIPNGTINLLTNSTSRIDITDTGVRLGAANARVTTILDEDTMASNSDTSLCTQQSIKAYADTKLTDIVNDVTPQLGATLDGNSYNIEFDTLTGIADDAHNEQLFFTKTASAVNYLNITNAATGSPPVFSAKGDDANIGITLTPKGTGNVKLGTMTLDSDQTIGAGQDNYVLTYDNATGLVSLEAATGGGLANVVEDLTPQLGGQLDVNGFALGDGSLELLTFTETGSAVNQINITNNSTTNAPILGVAGDDTNISLTLSAKGTGTVTLGNNLNVNAKKITSADGTDYIDIPNGTVDLVTNSTSRMDITDSGVRMGAANSRVTTILDEDTMSSDSATALATQQSIKAYVDSQSALVKISSATASASASISFTGLSSTYHSYIVVIADLQGATDQASLDMRMSTDNGSSYDSGASAYSWCVGYKHASGLATAVQDTADSEITLTATATAEDPGNATNETLSGTIQIYNPSSSFYTRVVSDLEYSDESGAAEHVRTFGGGHYASTTAVNAIQFFMSSGNIAQGTFVLYGRKA